MDIFHRLRLTKKRAEKSPRIYMDYAAATPVYPRVLCAMEPYWNKHFGNPGAIHREGVVAKNAVANARERIAKLLNARADEIIFTGGGTEANQLAILGVLGAHKKSRGVHVVVSAIEHSSVLKTIDALKARGVSVTYAPVDGAGRVDPRTVREAITEKTILVSIMHVNGEIGSVQPIAEIAKEIRRARKQQGHAYPYFHTDATQALLFYAVDFLRLGVDLLTLDAQKLYGPKGAGLLCRKKHVPLVPLMFGGGQESGLRPGTENVPLIVGFAEALTIAESEREQTVKKLTKLRDYFFELIKNEIPQAEVNGGMEHRAPNNVNISIPGMESEFMVLWLDEKGIACGSRSACMTHGDISPYVITALGKKEDVAKSTLRFTLGKGSERAHVRHAVDILKDMLKKFDHVRNKDV